MALVAAGPAGATDLMQAYELARQNDPQFSASESQRNATGEGVVQSRAALLPQVSAEVGYSRSESSSNGSRALGSGVQAPSLSANESSTDSYGFSVRQTIYDHANYTRLNASRARARQADAEFDAAADSLVVRVADAYFNVLTGIETLASSRAEERSVKRQLDQAEKRLEVGLAPITDVHEARARYDSARANAIAAAAALDDAHEALSEITGQPLSGLKGLSADYRPGNSDGRSAEDWLQAAIAGNPTLRARQEALVAAEKDVETARAGHYPTLGASYSWSDSSTDGTNRVFLPLPASTTPFGSDSDGGTFGITLSIPLFSGFATQSRLRQAIHTRDAVADQLEQQKRAITRQTRSAWRALQSGAAEVEARRLAVVSAQAAYEAGEAGLEVGTRTIVDVLIAQQSLYQAQREYARARHAFLVNTLRLKQAAGSLDVNDVQEVNRVLVANAADALNTSDGK
jgi:outer membrane protein